MVLKEYLDYLGDVSKDWHNEELTMLYCVAGLVEETWELEQEQDISEQGDVLFYLFMLAKRVGKKNLPLRCDKHKDRTLLEVAVRLQSVITKYVFHGNDSKMHEVDDYMGSVYSKTMGVCKNDLDDILEANVLKLNMRHPDGKYTAYVNKNHEAEKEAIEKKVWKK